MILDTWPMAVQLWTLNDQLEHDAPATLKRLKATGYDVVETAGLLGGSAQDCRRMIDEAGLVCRSAHATMADLRDDPDRHIEAAKTLGAHWLVCASPQPPTPLPAGKDWFCAMRDAMTLDGWKANAAYLADLAPRVKAAGLELAYHNHFMEFYDHDGVTGFSLIAAADEALRLEVDLGWVKAGGADPLAVLRRYAGRIDLVHVKDFVTDASQPIGFRSVEAGQGMIDWKPVLTAARAAGVSLAIVEQEPPHQRDIYQSLAMSRDYLLSL